MGVEKLSLVAANAPVQMSMHLSIEKHTVMAATSEQIRKIVELENAADSLRAEGKYNEAIAKLMQALELDEKFVRTHLALGVLYHLVGDYDLAVKHGERAVELEPGDSFNVAALSVTYQRALAATGDMRFKEKAEEMLYRNQGRPRY
jgi:tetratricopeptide (TPR) repeat protein